MLAELLQALAEPRPRTVGQLADELGTDLRRLRIAVDHCRQLGYLESADPRCEASLCGGCRLPCGLSPRREHGGGWPAPVWWRLTARGRDVVARTEAGIAA
jgi:hypothetical protein